MDITLTEIRFSEGSGLLWWTENGKVIVHRLIPWGKNVHVLTELKSKPKRYELSVPIPSEAIAKGVHTVIISLVGSSDVLAKIPIVAGDVLSEDIRAEVSLLREELDLLKRAFRRHCSTT